MIMTKMETSNKKLLDPKANKEYYSKSDGHFMPIEQATRAHLSIKRIDWVREWVHKIQSGSHLDVGCKDGYLCLTLGAEGVPSIGIDPSVDAINEAKNKKKTIQDMDGKDNESSFGVAYLEEIPETLFYDTVSCLEVIEHVVDVDVALKKLCKLGQWIMISTPDADGVHGLKDSEQNEEHVRLFTLEELKKLVSKYGDIEEAKIVDHELFIIFQPKEHDTKEND